MYLHPYTFFFQGKLPLSGIIVRRLDSLEYPHAFEISGILFSLFDKHAFYYCY